MLRSFLTVELTASTSANNSNIIGNVHQNYANEMMTTLDNVSTTLDLNNQIYHLRGSVVFNVRV